ncbi:hypothetical protein ACAW74_27940 [Fibrella sp. WM1]|uniref:hypothetical protein n=1 Tax=Fibrella musci TaxID=3242485 RepID=UPI00351F848D
MPVSRLLPTELDPSVCCSPTYLWLVHAQYDDVIDQYPQPIIAFLQYCAGTGQPADRDSLGAYLVHVQRQAIMGVGRFLSLSFRLAAPGLLSPARWQQQPQVPPYCLSELIRYWGWSQRRIGPMTLNGLTHWFAFVQQRGWRGQLCVEWVDAYLAEGRAQGVSEVVLALRLASIRRWAGELCRLRTKLRLEPSQLPVLALLSQYHDEVAGWPLPAQPTESDDHAYLKATYRNWAADQLIAEWLRRGVTLASLPHLRYSQIKYEHELGVVLRFTDGRTRPRVLSAVELYLYDDHMRLAKGISTHSDDAVLFADWAQRWPRLRHHLRRRRWQPKKAPDEWPQQVYYQTEGVKLLERLRWRHVHFQLPPCR